MPLHLVGETIDKTRSHYLAETGILKPAGTSGFEALVGHQSP